MITTVAPSPNVVAEKLTGRDYVSYSGLALYQSCPLRWYFRYVAGLPEATVSASLVFGGAIHAAVQRHFEELLAGNPAPNLDELLGIYQNAWQQRHPDPIQFGKGDDVVTLEETAIRMLRAFQASDLARPAGTIIGVEEELRGKIMEDCPDLLARVDLLVDTGRELVVSDFKTSRSRWSQDQVSDSAEQLLLYSELVRQLVPGRTIKLEFLVITKAREPAVDRHVLAFDPVRIDRTTRVMERVWRAIEAGMFYPAPSPMNCPTCPFRAPCRAWQG